MVYMKPYPIELRQRVLSAVDAGGATGEQIAKTFQVSTAWIRRLLQRRRNEGAITPRGHGGGRRPAFDGPLLAELDRVVQRKPDVTLEVLQAHFAGRVDCSTVTIHNALRRLDYRFKKSRYERVSKTGQT
jgi:transposase